MLSNISSHIPEYFCRTRSNRGAASVAAMLSEANRYRARRAYASILNFLPFGSFDAARLLTNVRALCPLPWRHVLRDADMQLCFGFRFEVKYLLT